MPDLKFHAISIFEPTDFNLSVRSLAVALIADRDIAVFDFNRPRRDAARQLTMSRLATDGLHISVENLLHGLVRTKCFLIALYLTGNFREEAITDEKRGDNSRESNLHRKLLLVNTDFRLLRPQCDQRIDLRCPPCQEETGQERDGQQEQRNRDENRPVGERYIEECV